MEAIARAMNDKYRHLSKTRRYKDPKRRSNSSWDTAMMTDAVSTDGKDRKSAQYEEEIHPKSAKADLFDDKKKRAYESDDDDDERVSGKASGAKKQRIKQEDDEEDDDVDQDEGKEESKMGCNDRDDASDSDGDPISTDRVNWDDEADTKDDEADTKDDEADTKDDEADNKTKGSKRARSGADDASDSDGGSIPMVPMNRVDEVDGQTLATVEEAFDRNFPKNARGKSYLSLCKSLYTTLLTSKGNLSKVELDDCLEKILVLQTKYKQLLHPSMGSLQRGEQYTTYPKTRKEVKARMKGTEEAKHPWMNNKRLKAPVGGILDRAWDPVSRCKMIRGDVGFLSMGCDSSFSTVEGRKDNLTCHANWGNRRKTPFISTTPSIELLARHYIPHFKRRQTYETDTINMIRITAINFNARRAGRWPILHMLDELKHYDVKIPAKCSHDMYKDEYILPFRIRPEEIIGDWHQTDVEAWLRTRDPHKLNYELWEREVVRPLYVEHERSRKAGEDEKTRKSKAGELIKRLMPGAKLTNWYTGVEGCEYA